MLSKNYLFMLLFAILFMIATTTHAFVITKPLEEDKAFAFSMVVENANTATVNWQMPPGYYLYRDKILFSFEPKVTTDIRFPQGEVRQDLKHAEYQIYENNVSIPVVFDTDAKKIQMNIDYQGCSDKGVCYPPMHKSVTVDFSTVPANIKTAIPTQDTSMQSLLTDQHSVRSLLGSQNLVVLLMIFAGLGLLLAFTPCVLPMIPILTSIIVGHKQPVTTNRAFLLSTTYVLGSSLTYAFAGMAAAYMGSSLQTSLQQPWIIAIVSGLFVLLALSLFGLYELRLPKQWQNRITSISRKQEGGTYAGVFIMGMVSTLIVSPCVTAPLVGVLMYIAETGNIVLGAGALFVMGLGMGIPLIVIGVTTSKWLPRRGPWMTGVQQIFGVIMLIMAVWLLSRVASLITIMTFASVLFFGAALFFGFYRPAHHGRPGLNRSIGMLAGLASILLIGAINTPYITNSISHSKETPNIFTIVHNVDELNKQLNQAQASGKPVLLDFYADWCQSCVIMDKNVFTKPDVINELQKFVLLRADLSKNSSADADLLKNFDVIAPPTVLFFNNRGKEVNSHRIVGELNAMEFIARVDTFITASCDKNETC